MFRRVSITAARSDRGGVRPGKPSEAICPRTGKEMKEIAGK